MWKQIYIFFVFFPTFTLQLIGRTQSAGVRGYLMCGNKPAANVLVKLYDDDRGTES